MTSDLHTAIEILGLRMDELHLESKKEYDASFKRDNLSPGSSIRNMNYRQRDMVSLEEAIEIIESLIYGKQ